MRNVLPNLLLGFVAIAIGLTSCEKEEITCVKCMQFNDKDFGRVENCVGYIYIDTEEDFNNLAIELEKAGHRLTFSENCDW
ncbi:MAG TPA: hypothetical protein VLZ75_07840 [Chitinophagales bacterium]|nr:hypothetical protein [Chitinophagales bacterium]